MPVASTKGWDTWLNNHSTRKVYDDHPDKVTRICKGTTPEAKFENLTETKTDYENLQAVTTGTKNKIPCYVVLTPSLAQALLIYKYFNFSYFQFHFYLLIQFCYDVHKVFWYLKPFRICNMTILFTISNALT